MQAPIIIEEINQIKRPFHDISSVNNGAIAVGQTYPGGCDKRRRTSVPFVSRNWWKYGTPDSAPSINHLRNTFQHLPVATSGGETQSNKGRMAQAEAGRNQIERPHPTLIISGPRDHCSPESSRVTCGQSLRNSTAQFLAQMPLLTSSTDPSLLTAQNRSTPSTNGYGGTFGLEFLHPWTVFSGHPLASASQSHIVHPTGTRGILLENGFMDGSCSSHVDETQQGAALRLGSYNQKWNADDLMGQGHLCDHHHDQASFCFSQNVAEQGIGSSQDEDDESSVDPSDDASADAAVKFRAFQAEKWTDKFDELLRFREAQGHCLVPNFHPENPALAQWTKRQRYQYKLKQLGKRSTITDERILALNRVGFIWDSHAAVWAERLEELKVFRKRHGHCNVKSRYEANPQLAIWVKRQRRQWKHKMEGKAHSMTDERQALLEEIGFQWDMRFSPSSVGKSN